MKRGASLIAALAATVLAIPLATVPAAATPDGKNVVISEVYTYGDSKGNEYRDYVELYNPTDAPIDVSGWSVQYVAKTGKHQSFALNRAGQGVWVTTGEFHKRGDVFVRQARDSGDSAAVPGGQGVHAGVGNERFHRVKNRHGVILKRRSDTFSSPASSVHSEKAIYISSYSLVRQIGVGL
ncbi:lamin tail domain-containing protein [Trueperella pyogenes]|uniref:lamin tail domain-containing protein n=1 Tax=Trueperella pyogenes TaxID=1661 RepID=UPI003246A83B